MQPESTRLSIFPILIFCVIVQSNCFCVIVQKFSENVRYFVINNMQQRTSFVNLSRAIIKKSLERVDSDSISFGVLDSPQCVTFNHFIHNMLPVAT